MVCDGVGEGRGLTLKSAGRTAGKVLQSLRRGTQAQASREKELCSAKDEASQREAGRRLVTERHSGTSREKGLEREERWPACVRGG